VPELPEVELARRVLARELEGARVERVVVADERLDAVALGGLVGTRGVKVERRGKWLRLTFARKRTEVFVFAHLGMSGRWLVADAGAPAARHERVRLEVARARWKTALLYTDVRRFGRVLVAPADFEAWSELGPDPLLEGTDPERLHAALGARRVAIKVALLDQRLLAGVGNIHATEALWRAKIDPRSRADALTLPDVRALVKGIRATLTLGLRSQQGDEPAYVQDGAANRFKVYDRTGPCPRCGTNLVKIVLGGRGTTYCPGCQRRIR
jgi:formamidopyrimidine-DNA glycosylase